MDRVRLENVYNKIFHLVEWEEEKQRIPIASKAKSRLSVRLRSSAFFNPESSA